MQVVSNAVGGFKQVSMQATGVKHQRSARGLRSAYTRQLLQQEPQTFLCPDGYQDQSLLHLSEKGMQEDVSAPPDIEDEAQDEWGGGGEGGLEAEDEDEGEEQEDDGVEDTEGATEWFEEGYADNAAGEWRRHATAQRQWLHTSQGHEPASQGGLRPRTGGHGHGGAPGWRGPERQSAYAAAAGSHGGTAGPPRRGWSGGRGPPFVPRGARAGGHVAQTAARGVYGQPRGGGRGWQY